MSMQNYIILQVNVKLFPQYLSGKVRNRILDPLEAC